MSELTRTLKFDGTNLYAEMDNKYNATVGPLTNSLNQHFYFHYDENMKAYKICSAFNKDLVLSYDSYLNVVTFAKDIDLEEKYL